MRFEFFANVESCILLFLDQARGHDNVGIDCPERDKESLRGNSSPAFRFAYRILIAYHEGSLHFVAELHEAVIGITPQHKCYVTFLKRGCDVGDALNQESIRPQVSVGIKRHRREERNDRFAERVCSLDRNIQCRIVDATLGALHPVDNACAIGIGRPFAAHTNARILNYLFEIIHTAFLGFLLGIGIEGPSARPA